MERTAHSGASRVPPVQAPGSGMKPRTGLVLLLTLALFFGALSAFVLVPRAQHLRSLHDGVRARATLHKDGSCMLGACEVEFTADGRTVIATLPPGSGGGKQSVGAELAVRHRADDPRVVARDADTGGGGAAVAAVMSACAALAFLSFALVATFSLARTRKPT
ncbi:hypothetical protein [Streptomyces phytohabitans]|uniref:hypothetical protein n=1 Tax=Streptomyces phytohabitans TaxID=1150371 RepID=UPI00345C43E0